MLGRKGPMSRLDGQNQPIRGQERTVLVNIQLCVGGGILTGRAVMQVSAEEGVN